MLRRPRHFLIAWMLIAAAAPPPGMACYLIPEAGRGSSDSSGGPDSAASNPTRQARGRNRVNPPDRPDACLTPLKLAGEGESARRQATCPEVLPPRKADRPPIQAAPFRSTTHRLRC